MRSVGCRSSSRPRRSAKGGSASESSKNQSYPQVLVGYPQPCQTYPDLSTESVDRPVNGLVIQHL
jgi:hypothetical protein